MCAVELFRFMQYLPVWLAALGIFRILNCLDCCKLRVCNVKDGDNGDNVVDLWVLRAVIRWRNVDTHKRLECQANSSRF